MTSEPKWRSVKTGCRVPDRYARLHPERVYDEEKSAELIFDPDCVIEPLSTMPSPAIVRDGPFRFKIGQGPGAVDYTWSR